MSGAWSRGEGMSGGIPLRTPRRLINDQSDSGLATHLNGLRSWLGELDRVIRFRSRVGLALIVLAIAGAGVALYIGIEASRDDASAAEAQALRGQIEARGRQAARSAARLESGLVLARSRAAKVNTEVAQLQAQVRALQEGAVAAKGKNQPSHGGASATSSAAGPKGSAAAAGAGESTGQATAVKKKASGGKPTTVSTTDSPKLGAIIVNSAGLTLYDFQKDKGTRSSCYGSCAGIWPPLTTSGLAEAAGGAEASKLGTVKRTDGRTQVTYGGHPLYTFAGDQKPGQANGNGLTEFGGAWHALQPDGTAAGG